MVPDSRALSIKIAVIGQSGQLSRALADAAVGRRDVELTCVGRPQINFNDPQGLTSVLVRIKPDLVINTAAYTAVDKAEAEPDLAFSINRDGAGVLAQVCAEQRLPLVHISTDYVFDGASAAPYREADTCHPQGVYGRSKFEGEQMVLMRHPNAIVLRTAWLHSPYGSNFVRTMLRLAGERDELRVVADQKGSPTYAPDLAEALLDIVQHRIAASASNMAGIFHLAGSGQARWWEVASAIMAEAAAQGRKSVPVTPITTAEYPTPARRPAWSVLDGAKTAAIFGIMLPPWRDGLRRGVGVLLNEQ